MLMRAACAWRLLARSDCPIETLGRALEPSARKIQRSCIHSIECDSRSKLHRPRSARSSSDSTL
jgi:hypothetical protein